MVVNYTKSMKSYCKKCCREVLHEYGFSHENGEMKKFKRCLKCTLVTKIK